MGWHLNFSPALTVPSSALIVPLPVDKHPHKLAPKMPSNIPRNPPFCSFALFLIVSLVPFANLQET